MKKLSTFKVTVMGLIFALVLIPQLALAAWWNPFSWNWKALFNEPTKEKITTDTTTTSSNGYDKLFTSTTTSTLTATTTPISMTKKKSVEAGVKPLSNDLTKLLLKMNNTLFEIRRERLNVSSAIYDRKESRDFINSVNVTNDNRWNLLVGIENETIKYYESVDSYLNDMDTYILARMKVYTDDKEVPKLEVVANEVNAVTNNVSHEISKFENYDKNYRAQLLATLKIAKDNAKIDSQNNYIIQTYYTPTYQPVVPQVQFPKTTNCYGSSVGGMTPGAGSITCYTQ